MANVIFQWSGSTDKFNVFRCAIDTAAISNMMDISGSASTKNANYCSSTKRTNPQTFASTSYVGCCFIPTDPTDYVSKIEIKGSGGKTFELSSEGEFNTYPAKKVACKANCSMLDASLSVSNVNRDPATGIGYMYWGANQFEYDETLDVTITLASDSVTPEPEKWSLLDTLPEGYEFKKYAEQIATPDNIRDSWAFSDYNNDELFSFTDGQQFISQLKSPLIVVLKEGYVVDSSQEPGYPYMEDQDTGVYLSVDGDYYMSPTGDFYLALFNLSNEDQQQDCPTIFRNLPTATVYVPPAKKYDIRLAAPEGYESVYFAEGKTHGTGLTREDTIITPWEKPSGSLYGQVEFEVGDVLPAQLFFVLKEGYEFDNSWEFDSIEPCLVDKKTNGKLYYNITTWVGTSHPNNDFIVMVFQCNTANSVRYQPDSELTLIDLPVATLAVTRYFVQLDMQNCTADQTDKTTLKEGDNYLVHFTPDSGYEFSDLPYYIMSGETYYGTANEDGSCTVVIDSINSNVTIIAVAVASTVNPPAPSTGLPFVNMYNPTFSQLKEAADKLFIDIGTGNAIDLKQYIVELHKVFVPVSTNEEFGRIYFGRYNSGVDSKVINQRVSIVTCGIVTLKEQYGNALDYSPYTNAKIWLPFIGFENVSISYFMNKEVELTYYVDLINGRCVAELSNMEAVFYRFVGTCKLDEPYYLNEGSTITKEWLNEAYNLVDYTPYLLVERPIDRTPEDSDLDGEDTYQKIILGEHPGYVKCVEVDVYGTSATNKECQEIENLLKRGVIIC